MGTSRWGTHRVSNAGASPAVKQQRRPTVDTLASTVHFWAERHGERVQMSEPTNDGKQKPDPDPDRDPGKDPNEIQDQIPESVFNDPTAPVWADPTAPIPAPPPPPGAAVPQSDEPAANPQANPPPPPPMSNPYAQQQPAQPYGQPQPGQQYPAYSQQPYATGAPATPSNTSAIILTIFSGLSLIFCNIFALSLIHI